MEPIDMILHCPNCGLQHVDAPDEVAGWTNPPHKSHLCRPEDGGCGVIFRPADVPTNGVARIETRGERDTWPVVCTCGSNRHDTRHTDSCPVSKEAARFFETARIRADLDSLASVAWEAFNAIVGPVGAGVAVEPTPEREQIAMRVYAALKAASHE